MVGHQHESINVQGIENSVTLFHQNIRGLLNKSEELISSFSPDIPQVLCLTEHHLKHFEIDFMYMDQYKLALNFAGNLTRVVEFLFLCMIPFSVRILI